MSLFLPVPQNLAFVTIQFGLKQIKDILMSTKIFLGVGILEPISPFSTK